MSSQSNKRAMAALMEQFGHRTGMVTPREPSGEIVGDLSQRYLWTDAFAVINYLTLATYAKDTPQKELYEHLAIKLVDSVHHVLGRHRDDSPQKGKWLSGLPNEAGDAHPTIGGLRIGKKDPERLPEEPFDSEAEWDRDGQYFHYLTKWMMALEAMATYYNEPKYTQWAMELAGTAARAFVVEDPSHSMRNLLGKRHKMYWKMSVDLTRPALPQMGAHDPLDGYITFRSIKQSAQSLGLLEETSKQEELQMNMGIFRKMIHLSETSDPLSLGGMLLDACRLYALEQHDNVLHRHHDHLLPQLLKCCVKSLENFETYRLKGHADNRLAFRELGLAIGLGAVEDLSDELKKPDRHFLPIEKLDDNHTFLSFHKIFHFFGLRQEINEFWRNPEHQHSLLWKEHVDINTVMLATSLVPDGIVSL